MNVKRCRTCYTEFRAGVGVISLNSRDPSSNIKVWAKLQLCVPEIELTRTNEEYVCNNCSQQLKSAYNFRTMCLKTEAKFQELYSSIQYPQPNQNSPQNTLHQESIEDLITKACREIPELQGREETLNCNVSVVALPEKVVKVTKRNNSVLICNYCRSIFLCESNFSTHVAKHFENTGTPKEHIKLRCESCNITFRSLNIYELHLKFMHPNMYGTYLLRDDTEGLLDIKSEVIYEEQPITKSEKIKKIPSKNPPIILKVKTSSLFNREKIKATKCSFCLKVCSNHSSLVKHLKVHQRNTTMCTACKRPFVDIDSHQMRCKRIKKDSSNKLFQCPFCKTEPFIEKKSFLGHLWIHGKIKIRKCNRCNIKFDTLSRFACHLINYGCPYPESNSTSSIIKRKKRVKSHIICPICFKRQKTNSHLAAHIAKHPNKTILCTGCTVRFRNVPSYMSHITACKRRRKTELVMVKQEESDNDEELNVEVQGILLNQPDIPELVSESQLLDPLNICDDLVTVGTNESKDAEDVDIDLQLQAENERREVRVENTDVIVQQINMNIKNIIEKMNCGETQPETSSEIENLNIPGCVERSVKNLNRESLDSVVVSSSSNESSSIIEHTGGIPSTSTMLTV